MVAAVGQLLADATKSRWTPCGLAVRTDLLCNAEKSSDDLTLVDIHDATASLTDGFGERRCNVIALAESLQIILNFLVVPSHIVNFCQHAAKKQTYTIAGALLALFSALPPCAWSLITFSHPTVNRSTKVRHASHSACVSAVTTRRSAAAAAKVARIRRADMQSRTQVKGETERI